MDKADFVAKAPVYYMLAIGQALDGVTIFAHTREQISKRAGGGLVNDALFNAAIRMLQERGAIEIELDDFGPTSYQATQQFQDWWDNRASRESNVAERMFGFFHEDRKDWIDKALSRINGEASTHWLTDDDFAEVTPDRWEPIPLNREDGSLNAATEAIDAAIKEIESNNGYAASAPGERNYVVRQLRTFNTYLKTEAQITWLEVKTFGLEPLGVAIKRFGGAAVGLVSEAARQAVLDWLKRNAPKVVEWFLT